MCQTVVQIGTAFTITYIYNVVLSTHSDALFTVYNVNFLTKATITCTKTTVCNVATGLGGGSF